MIQVGETRCPACKGELRYYDRVKRYIRYKYGKRYTVTIKRYRCCDCGSIHRALPSFIFPYKHYHKEIIIGVMEGLITSDTLGYEDWPNSSTMVRWTARKIQML